MNQESKFWQTKSLEEMNDNEWESLCDGCGRCCLIKLEDEDSNDVYITNVACELLDLKTCRCSDYEHRIEKVPMCINLKNNLSDMVNYLPASCAYRLLYYDKSLESWHPLVSSNINSTHEAKMSVSEFAVVEKSIHPDQLELHIIESLTNKGPTK